MLRGEEISRISRGLLNSGTLREYVAMQFPLVPKIKHSFVSQPRAVTKLRRVASVLSFLQDSTRCTSRARITHYTISERVVFSRGTSTHLNARARESRAINNRCVFFICLARELRANPSAVVE